MGSRRAARRAGIRAIHEHVSGAQQVPPHERNPAERFLCDDAELERQRGEDDRDIVDALVIGREDVAPGRIEALEPLDGHADAGGLQDQP